MRKGRRKKKCKRWRKSDVRNVVIIVRGGVKIVQSARKRPNVLATMLRNSVRRTRRRRI